MIDSVFEAFHDEGSRLPTDAGVGRDDVETVEAALEQRELHRHAGFFQAFHIADGLVAERLEIAHIGHGGREAG
jgi:hypothetical protein